MATTTYTGNQTASGSISNNVGDSTDFRDASSAGTATITDNGGATQFYDTSTAGNATLIMNSGGGTTFYNTSTAGAAILTVNSGGSTFFANTSTAGNAALTTNGGGSTNFITSSTAGNAVLTTNSGGNTSFYDTSTAGNAALTTNSGGLTFFISASTAGNATLTTNSGGNTFFVGSSTAGNAALTTNSGGTTSFYDTSTAGNAALTTNSGGITDFSRTTGPNGDGRVSAGSIAGAGTYNLGGTQLTVGGNDTGTTVSGTIRDGGGGGGSGASLIKTGTGTLTLTGNNTYSGGTTINAGTLELGGSTSAGSGPIAFGPGGGQLALQTGAQAIGGTFGNRLDDFTGSNSLDLRGFAFTGPASYNVTNSAITITGGVGGTQTQTFSLRNGASTYYASSDGNGGTLLTARAPTLPMSAACYASGTRIRVLRGDTIQDLPIESLQVGECVITAAGRARLIRWIGSRHYPGLTAPKADRPVRIKAEALDDGVPACDLLVSPDHALLVDGLFVAAGHLVNGTSIIRGEPVVDLSYWHVELDDHDVLLAENTPAESFLAAQGLHERFDGRGAPLPDRMPTEPYAPRVEGGAKLQALRRRLILRAGLSVQAPHHGDLRGSLDLCEIRDGDLRVAGWARDADHPCGPVCLDITVDGAVAAMALAEVYRSDLAAAGEGTGWHGFDFGLGAADLRGRLAPGVGHTVEVRRSADRRLVGAMRLDETGTWSRPLAA